MGHFPLQLPGYLNEIHEPKTSVFWVLKRERCGRAIQQSSSTVYMLGWQIQTLGMWRNSLICSLFLCNKLIKCLLSISKSFFLVPRISPLSSSFPQSVQGLWSLTWLHPQASNKEIWGWSFLTETHRWTSKTHRTQSDHAAITSNDKDSFRVWFSHRRNIFELHSLSCLLNIPQVHFKSKTLSSGERSIHNVRKHFCIYSQAITTSLLDVIYHFSLIYLEIILMKRLNHPNPNLCYSAAKIFEWLPCFFLLLPSDLQARLQKCERL